MLDIASVTAFSLVFMRMSGCILFNPFFGRRNLPNMLKIGMALVFSFVVVSFAKPEVSPVSAPIEYIVLLLLEFMVGFFIGFVVTLFSFVISFGGEMIDLQMGVSMSKIYDPQSNTSMSLSATYLNILFVFLFFAADGHITLIHLFLTSGELIPFGRVQILPQLSTAVIDLFCQSVILAVKLALPIIAVEILTEIAVGILMKAIPQINIFAVNIQAKILIGLVMMIVLFAPFANFLERLITLLFNSIETVVRLM